MHITLLRIENVRSFDKAEISFSKSINLFVGANNNGKSTILNCIHFLQGDFLNQSDIRLGNKNFTIHLNFENYYTSSNTIIMSEDIFEASNLNRLKQEVRIQIDASGNISKNLHRYIDDHPTVSFPNYPSIEPNNLIYPFLSKRKVVTYNESMNLQNSNSVKGNFEDLFSKIDRLCNEDFLPASQEYKQACIEILGYRISTVTSPNGKKGALIINNLVHIPITSMGEGIVNIIGLIADMCLAENKIFLIEELENDIHPKALKGLLKLIVEKSKTNQFFISTHSNIIVKYLGAESDTKIFNVSMKYDKTSTPIPTSSVVEVSESEEERRLLLEELGYEFNDFGLWDAWLFLEESSAERIIKDYLIPWFCPKLKNKLRTYSSSSSSEVEIKFKDFNNLFVFLHLTPSYKNKAWVVIDAGLEETKIMEKMRSYYVVNNGWNKNNFQQFSKHDFEEYYPFEFQAKFQEINILKKDSKRKGKENLLNDLIRWIVEDEKRAKTEFKNSASEVIEILKTIAKSL